MATPRTASRTGRALTPLLLALPAAGQSPCDWDPAANAPVERVIAASVAVDQRLLVFGGYLSNLKATSRVDAFDTSTNSWSPLADMPAALTHAGFALDDRTVWIAGGFVGNHPGPVTAAVSSYDVDLDTWTPRRPLPAPRGGGGLFRLGRDLHFVGGVDVDRDTNMADHWVLDLDNPTAWVASDPLPDARNHFGTLALGTRGYVIGGQFGHDTNPLDVTLVHAWERGSGWTRLADLPLPRSHFEPSVHALSGRIVIAGGRCLPLGWETLPDLLAYDPLVDAWEVAGYLPQPLISPIVGVIAGETRLTGGGPTENQPTIASFRRPADLGPPTRLRINCAGGALALTQDWCPDLGDLGGKEFSNPAVGPIAQTEDDELYRNARTGSDASPTSLGYRIPVPNGRHALRLHFAEIFWGASGGAAGGVGSRVFDVTLEGQLVLDNLDVYAEVGPATALVKSLEVTVTDGVLELDFDAVVDRPLLAGIEILTIDDGGGYCIGAPNSVGPGGTLAWAGSLSVAQADVLLAASGCPPGGLGVFLQSQTTAQIPLFSGFLCVGAPFVRLAPAAKVLGPGTAQHVLDLAARNMPQAQIQPGSTWNFQFWYRDAALATANFTDAVTLTFAP